MSIKRWFDLQDQGAKLDRRVGVNGSGYLELSFHDEAAMDERLVGARQIRPLDAEGAVDGFEYRGESVGQFVIIGDGQGNAAVPPDLLLGAHESRRHRGRRRPGGPATPPRPAWPGSTPTACRRPRSAPTGPAARG